MDISKLQKTPIKMTLFGPPGSGKTSACACLAEHKNILIADFDNGLAPFINAIQGKKHKTVEVFQYFDKIKTTSQGEVYPDGQPTAWLRFLEDVHHGFKRDDGSKLELKNLDDSWIFLVDSGTFMADAAVRGSIFM